jgi:hypothetical protein
MMQMAAGFPVANTKLLTALYTELCVLCPEGSVAIKTPINSLKPSGNYTNHLLWQSVMLHFVFIGFARFSL